jgi:hypothetical protein
VKPFAAKRVAVADPHPRIDEFLPNHDFTASYEIRISAPTSVAYQCLLRSDFSELWVVRLLMTVRSGKGCRAIVHPATCVSGSKPQALSFWRKFLISQSVLHRLVDAAGGSSAPSFRSARLHNRT